MKRGDIYKQMTQSMVCTHGAKYQCYHLLITPTKHWIWFPLIAIIYVSFFHFPFNKLAFIVAAKCQALATQDSGPGSTPGMGIVMPAGLAQSNSAQLGE